MFNFIFIQHNPKVIHIIEYLTLLKFYGPINQNHKSSKFDFRGWIYIFFSSSLAPTVFFFFDITTIKFFPQIIIIILLTTKFLFILRIRTMSFSPYKKKITTIMNIVNPFILIFIYKFKLLLI
jgi:hypothetical protein